MNFFIGLTFCLIFREHGPPFFMELGSDFNASMFFDVKFDQSNKVYMLYVKFILL